MTTSTHNAAKQPEKPKYPYIGAVKESGLTVWFIRSGEGAVLIKGISTYGHGQFSDTWEERHFTPLPAGDSVTITQQ